MHHILLTHTNIILNMVMDYYLFLYLFFPNAKNCTISGRALLLQDEEMSFCTA